MPRLVDDRLSAMLAEFPALLINGARGIGKTTTATQQAESVFRLEDPDVLADVTKDPKQMIRAKPPVLIDEWQRYPESMNLVKLAVDDDRTPGRFVLAGTPSHPRVKGIHSGAMRVVHLEMRPMSLAERDIATPTVSLGTLLEGATPHIDGRTALAKSDYASTVLASGFPELQRKSATYREAYLETYFDRLVQKDITQVTNGGTTRASSRTIIRWLVAYARTSSTIANFTTISEAVLRQEGHNASKDTLKFYRGVLEDLGVIDELPGWAYPLAPLSGCSKAERHNLVDPALAASLLELTTVESLMRDAERDGPQANAGRTIFGQLFESLVAQSVRAYAYARRAKTYWLGTRRQGDRVPREVDLVVVDRRGKVLAIEVKSASDADDSDARHLRWLRHQLGERWADGVIVNTGEQAYRRDDHIAVVPAALLGP